MRRTVAALLAVVLILSSLAFSASAESPAAYTIEKKNFPFVYCFDKETQNSEINLYFINGGDVPYIALSEFLPILAEMYNTRYECEEDARVTFDLQVTGQSDGSSVFIVTRPDNKSACIFQPSEDTIRFTSYDSFIGKPGSSALVTAEYLPDLKQTMVLSDAILENFYAMREGKQPEKMEMPAAAEDPAADHALFVLSNTIYNRRGNVLTLRPGDYQIDLAAQEEECYIPLQTMSDVFFSYFYITFVFNGEKVIGDVSGGELTPQAGEAAWEDMSEGFAMFNFRELCFFLDAFYGLKAEHDIDSFSDFFALDAGLLPQLTGTDALAFDYAMTRVMSLFLDDGHSAVTSYSWRSGIGTGMGAAFLAMGANYGYSGQGKTEIQTAMTAARKAAYPEGVPGYEEIGDTAFITFDSFTTARSFEEYYELEDPDNPQDTIELLMYANRQIRREGSPVKNIVMDLSMNGGGTVSAAIAAVCWYTGEARFALRNTMTGAQTISCYRTDLNVNGAALSNPDNPSMNYDPGDTVAGQYNLYCIISPLSFSCGNLLPAFFEQSGKVTLIGQRSGGGSNAVLPASTASGLIYQISGPLQLSTYKNGSFYGIDQGIEPHVRLNHYDSYYNREALVEMIHGLK